jgi:hypothetical protein
MPAGYSYGEPIAALMDIHSRGVDSQWMRKRAAAGVFANVDIKPEPGFSYIHLITMGASDRYGLNRNGDGFLSKSGELRVPEPKPGTPSVIKIARGLQEAHCTFRKDAWVFSHHVNKDPEKKEGDIYKEAYNLPMERGELIIKVPNGTWHDDIEKLASGRDVDFSMSTKVPYDYCTWCGNKARSRREYCDHLLDDMGTITKSGHQIGAMNDWMDFFDISRVRVGADRIAKGLLKAAFDGRIIVSAAEMAEQLTLFPPSNEEDLFGLRIPSLDKAAVLKKLSDIEKEIEAIGSADSPLTRLSTAVPSELEDSDLKRLSVPRSRLMDMFGTLADAQICLSLEDFLKLLMGSRYPDVEHAVPQAKDMLPGVFTRMTSSNSLPIDMDDFNLGSDLMPRGIREAVSRLTPTHSLGDEPVQRRVTLVILREQPKPELRQATLLKGSADEELADRLAQAYAMYKIAFCQRAGFENKVLTELAVLQHYVL